MPNDYLPYRTMTRRRALGLIAAGLSASALSGCNETKFHSIDIEGAAPPLAFAMTRAGDRKAVTQADYRGKITLLYFGYTSCPDICPTTLSNVADCLRALGKDAEHIRVLFVTVDPTRDTLPVLADYGKAFAPQIDALRGTPDQLARLARRYRVAYSATPAANGKDYEVTHSSVVYVFDGSGKARLLVPLLGAARPDISGTTADLKRLIDETQTSADLFTRLRKLV
jgi:protein SCO1/2